MELNYKKKIHIILPGGGVKGSYQAGFLYTLGKYFNKAYEVKQIDGTSVGSLNGISMYFEKYDNIKEMWFNLKSIKDIFTTHSRSSLLNAYSSYYNMGLKKNDKLINIVNNFFKKNNKKDLSNYNCVVTNLSTSRYEYINGTNPNIKEYIIASSSPWVLIKPTKINNNYYTDGALLQQFPLKNIKNIKNIDHVLIVGVDNNYFQDMYSDIGTTLIDYIGKVLDVCVTHCNLNDILKLIKYEQTNKKFIICKFNANFKPLDFNKDNIEKCYNQGKIDALKFVLNNLNLKYFYKVSDYLNINNLNKINKKKIISKKKFKEI